MKQIINYPIKLNIAIEGVLKLSDDKNTTFEYNPQQIEKLLKKELRKQTYTFLNMIKYLQNVKK